MPRSPAREHVWPAFAILVALAFTPPPTVATPVPLVAGGEQLIVVGDRLFFQKSASDSRAKGHDIWVTDGTAAGTRRVFTSTEIAEVDLQEAVAIRNSLVFTGTDPMLGPGLYTLGEDGPPRRTTFRGGGPDGGPIRHLAHVPKAFPTSVYFTTETDRGLQLWRTAPTVEPAFLTPISVLRSPSCEGDDEVSLHPWARTLAAFVREDLDGDCSTTDDRIDVLWRIDGRTQGATRIAEARRLSDQAPITTLGDRLVFVGDDPSDPTFPLGALWLSDGTLKGTRPVRDLHPDLVSTGLALATTSTHVFFDGYTGTGCSTVWRTDGTPEGTESVSPLCASQEVPTFQVLGDAVFATLDEVGVGPRLFRLVGEPRRAERVHPEIHPSEARFQVAGGRLYLRGSIGGGSPDLYSTDGTLEGTRLEADLEEPVTRHDLVEMAGVGRHLVWQGQDGIDAPRSLWSVELECLATSETLCLGGGRFQIRSDWHHSPADAARIADQGRGIDLTRDTAGFTFFDGANVEMAIKILDGRAITGHWWVFLASLSNLGFDVEVVDTATGKANTYRNIDGSFASRGDLDAFSDPPNGASTGAADGATARLGAAVETVALPILFERGTGQPSTPCVPAKRVLCVDHEPGDGRFRLRASWRDFADGTGHGTAKPLTADTGGFWFFDPDNVELLVKVLDARSTNGYFWVFLGSLSNVEFTLEVDDTKTGERAVYTNPRANFASFGDVEALPDPP